MKNNFDHTQWTLEYSFGTYTIFHHIALVSGSLEDHSLIEIQSSAWNNYLDLDSAIKALYTLSGSTVVIGTSNSKVDKVFKGQ